jgi:hypothetical protein
VSDWALCQTGGRAPLHDGSTETARVHGNHPAHAPHALLCTHCNISHPSHAMRGTPLARVALHARTLQTATSRFRGQCYCILRQNALLNTTVSPCLQQADGQWGGVAGVHAFSALKVSSIHAHSAAGQSRWPDKNRAGPETTSSISGQLI